MDFPIGRDEWFLSPVKGMAPAGLAPIAGQFGHEFRRRGDQASLVRPCRGPRATTGTSPSPIAAAEERPIVFSPTSETPKSAKIEEGEQPASSEEVRPLALRTRGMRSMDCFTSDQSSGPESA